MIRDNRTRIPIARKNIQVQAGWDDPIRIPDLCVMSDDLQEAYDNGKMISPRLPEGKKNFLIDIDGTICDDIPNEEPERMATAEVFQGALEKCNKWYEEGHIITFFTSRQEEYRAVTEAWLNRHGFKYHGCLFGKPRGGNYHWIDNHIVRATRYNGRFTDLVERNVTIETFEEGPSGPTQT